MELRQLRYFAVVAKSENFSRASVELSISQSALSRQVALLEHELGVALFQRNGKRVSLTLPGRKFLKGAEHLLDRASKLKRSVAVTANRKRRTIVIGAPQSLGHALFPRIRLVFSSAHPDVSLVFVEALAESLENGIRNCEIEIAAGSFIEPSRDFESVMIVREQIYLVAAKSVATGLPATCAAAEAFSRPLILPKSGSRERRFWEQTASAKGCRLQIAVESDDVNLGKQMMREGVARMLLPAPAIQEFRSDPSVVMSLVRGIKVPRFIILRRERKWSPEIALLQKLIVDGVRSLAAH